MGGPFASRAAIRHLSILAAGLLVVLAFGAYLAIPATLTGRRGIVHGASNADVEARLPALRLLVVAALAACVLALYQAASRKLWPIGAAAALYLAVSLGGTAYAALVQRFVVAPNEQVKETPFIRHNIAATRTAFALDDVEERELSGDAALTREDIDENAATLKNVPLWDHQPLLDTFGQMQEIRTYYDFVSVDNDRYVIDGEYRQVMLSARELNSASLPNRSWINERLTFTHGYGLTLGPVNQVTREGLPVLFIKDLPPESSIADLQVSEPSIYFGELSNDHVFVEDPHARSSTTRRATTTSPARTPASGGVPLDSLFRKLLFSIRFRSMKMLLSDDLTAESRVLFHRRIIGAGRTRIAPFLTYDPDPYLVIADGRLFWIQDAYTTSTHYPYSTPIGGRHQLHPQLGEGRDRRVPRAHDLLPRRHDGPDRRHARPQRSPRCSGRSARCPRACGPRLRYPEGIFARAGRGVRHLPHDQPGGLLQQGRPVGGAGDRRPAGQALADAAVLHDHEAAGRAGRGVHPDAALHAAAEGQPRRLDGGAQRRRALRASCVVFQFPKQKVVFGPRQIVARINQDQVISPQITLWNQQGSQVIQGTLLVIPIEESLLYVRPLYLRAAGGRIPELKRVIVAYQNQIVMEESLEAALERIFPPGAESRPAPRCRPGARSRPRPRRRRQAAPPRTSRLAPASTTSGRSRRSARATGRSTARRSGGSGTPWSA